MKESTCYRPQRPFLRMYIWGRCYDHNFLRFSPIFGEKIGAFLKNHCYDQVFRKTSFSLSKKRQYFRQIFRRKYLTNRNIGSCIHLLPLRHAAAPGQLLKNLVQFTQVSCCRLARYPISPVEIKLSKHFRFLISLIAPLGLRPRPKFC
jgi:hypothetical protein